MNNAFRKFLLTLSLAMLIPLTHAKEPAETHEIRSDVMEYIMTNYKAATPAQRAAAIQDAQGLQGAMSANPADSASIQTAKQRLADATQCLYSQFKTERESGNFRDASRVSFELRNTTLNTQQRLMEFLKFNKAGKSIITSTEEGGCKTI